MWAELLAIFISILALGVAFFALDKSKGRLEEIEPEPYAWGPCLFKGCGVTLKSQNPDILSEAARRHVRKHSEEQDW